MKTFYIGHDNVYQQRQESGHPGWHTLNSEYESFQQQVSTIIARQNTPSSGRLLDLGCGAGNMSLWFSQKGYETYGIDIAPTAIEWAQSNSDNHGIKADFKVGNVVNLESHYPHEYFDAAFDGHCFHCIIGQDRHSFLSGVHNILKPGGYFMINTMCSPITQNIKNFDPQTKCTTFMDFASYYIGDEADILQEIQNAGFAIINCDNQPLEENKGTGYLIIEACKSC